MEACAQFQDNNITLAILGVFILWFGWFGFNPGSELAADNWHVCGSEYSIIRLRRSYRRHRT